MQIRHLRRPEQPDTPDVDDLIFGGQDEDHTKSEK